MFVPFIVFLYKFAQVAVQVLWAEFMENSFVRPLYTCPERFNAIGMRITPHIFMAGMLDRFVGERQVVVASKFVGIDAGALLGIFGNEAMQGSSGIDAPHRSCPHMIRGPVNDTQGGCITDTAAVLPATSCRRPCFFSFPPT